MAFSSRSYTRIADRYERIRGGDGRADELAAAALPWISGPLVCDVGAGTGVIAERLREAGHEVIACDISREMLCQATDRLPGRVHLSDATALALRAASVDTLNFTWVLHHVADVGAALGEAWRVLRPGGRVVSISGTAEPSADDMSSIFERMNDGLRPDRREQAPEIARLGADLGFDIVHEGLAGVTFTNSPDRLAASFETRDFSVLWDLPDVDWKRWVQPAIDDLRALPRPDEQRQRDLQHPLVVLERPPS